MKIILFSLKELPIMINTENIKTLWVNI